MYYNDDVTNIRALHLIRSESQKDERMYNRASDCDDIEKDMWAVRTARTPDRRMMTSFGHVTCS
jgi:hypothetical protein